MLLPLWLDRLLIPIYVAVGLALWGLIWLEAMATAVVVFLIVYPVCWTIGGRPLTARVLCTIVEKGIWRHMTFMLETWGRSRLEFGGERVPTHESVLVVANHIYIADFWILFSLAVRKGRLGSYACAGVRRWRSGMAADSSERLTTHVSVDTRCIARAGCIKIFAKNIVKYWPGFGWGGWLLGFPFLRRDWTEDEARIRQTFANLEASRLPVWLVTHPEGTRITPRKYAESMAYQKQHQDLPALRNLMLPRPKGFTATVQALRGRVLQAVYDVTLDYPEGVPALFSLCARRGPRIVVHVKRYPIASLPASEADLRRWLLERWVEKDELLQRMRDGNSVVDPVAEPWAAPDSHFW